MSDRESEIAKKAMSALAPKADVCGATGDVRFGPKADMNREGCASVRSRPYAPTPTPSIRRRLILSLHFRSFHPPKQIIDKARERAFKRLTSLASGLAFGG